MNALKEPFSLNLIKFSSADRISTHSIHLTSNINTFQADSNNNKYSFTIKKLFYPSKRKSSKTAVWYYITNLFRANIDPS